MGLLQNSANEKNEIDFPERGCLLGKAGGYCVCLSSLEKQQVFVRPGFIERIVYILFPGHTVKGLGIPG